MKCSNFPWPHTKITKILNIILPIIQAPMAGSATTPELVAAVSNAGGLGSLGAGYMTADEIKLAIKKIRALTNKPFSVNLFIPEKHHATDEQIEHARKVVQASCAELNFTVDSIKPPYAPPFKEQMNVIVEEKVPVFSFTFGIPSAYWLEIFKRNKLTLIGTATSLEEALFLEKNGIDAIVAQGSEAGGHRGTFLGKAENALMELSSLTSILVENIKVPIIAAGGIMNAKGIVDTLLLGASAIQMGTAFLCCTESGISPLYKKFLLDTSHDNTILTRAFSGKLARGIVNEFITKMQPHEKNILDYPIQNALTSAMRKEAYKQNNIDFMSMWAGRAAYLCKALPAAQLIEELNSKVIALLKHPS
jgi:nitronate monooxygenase